jgi:hypothetical protein
MAKAFESIVQGLQEAIALNEGIEELHRFREEYARKFDFDTDAICRDIQEKQASSGREIVSFPPRKPKQKKALGNAF